MLPQAIGIESLTLANHVESVNGLLYISGGGWTTHTRIAPQGAHPPLSHFGIALVVAVPWHQTNQKHQILIEIRDEDAKSLASITAEIQVGRAPRMRPGTIQYPSIALPINLTFPRSGGYEIVARIEGMDGSERRWAFEVKDIHQGMNAA